VRRDRRRRSDPLAAARAAAEQYWLLDASANGWPGVYVCGWVRSADERTGARHLCDALLGYGRTDVAHALGLYLRRAREVAAETGCGARMHVVAERLAASLN